MENCLLITVNKTEDLEKTLKSFGYEKRSGDGAYKKNFIIIVPKKNRNDCNGFSVFYSHSICNG